MCAKLSPRPLAHPHRPQHSRGAGSGPSCPPTPRQPGQAGSGLQATFLCSPPSLAPAAHFPSPCHLWEGRVQEGQVPLSGSLVTGAVGDSRVPSIGCPIWEAGAKGKRWSVPACAAHALRAELKAGVALPPPRPPVTEGPCFLGRRRLLSAPGFPGRVFWASPGELLRGALESRPLPSEPRAALPSGGSPTPARLHLAAHAWLRGPGGGPPAPPPSDLSPFRQVGRSRAPRFPAQPMVP